jgi:hypothetical protein
LWLVEQFIYKDVTINIVKFTETDKEKSGEQDVNNNHHHNKDNNNKGN